jgi:nodulation protein E
MERRRVVVTGLGGICSLGNSVPEIWSSMRAGRCGIGTIEGRPLGDARHRIGAEIRELPEHGIEHRRLSTMDRFSLLAVIAAGEAIAQSGITADSVDPTRIGTIIGVGIFGVESFEEGYRDLFLRNRQRVNVFAIPRGMPSAPTGQVGIQYGLRGPSFGITSACASSNHAFAAAADQIRLGRADVMVAGGADAPLIYGIVKGWEAMRALAREACRPFSADRDGLIIGEGAGIAVLESYEHAQARGAPILAEFAGSGLSADAGDIVSPTLEGPAAAMRNCLADADLAPGDVDYVNAHGTGTKANDQVETAAIRMAFGKAADHLSVSSTKSMHGHCMGASGAVEAIACLMALKDGVVPPTVGYRERDPECDLDVTPNIARPRQVRAAMSNAFAFGGTNAVVAFKRL